MGIGLGCVPVGFGDAACPWQVNDHQKFRCSEPESNRIKSLRWSFPGG